ncbi:MAG: hypothetical protein ACE5IY_19500 [bacterium]
MKPTLFLAGLFPDKNREILSQLCRHFRVIMLRGHNIARGRSPQPEIAEDLLGEQDQLQEHDEIFWQVHKLLQHTELELKRLFQNQKATPLTYEEYSSLYHISLSARYMAYIFNRVADRVKIDMVICNADYSASRRPIVVEAKRRGIPTLDLEHGFAAAGPGVSALRCQEKPTTLSFASDYVNLDNELEREYWQGYYQAAGLADRIKFVVNGTPNDVSYDDSIDPQTARQGLGLNPNMFTITLASTWVEAHRPSVLFEAQLDHAEYFKTVLACIAEVRRSCAIQLIIKMHPAFARNPVWTDAVNFLNQVARRLDTRIDLMTLADLSEIIAASDLLICPQASSLLWEFFLADTPGIVLPMPSFYFKAFDKEKLNDSNLLFKRACMQFVFSPDELKQAIRHYMDPQNYKAYQKRAQELRREKNIRALTVAQKCENICNWVRAFLEDKTRPGALDNQSGDEASANQAALLFETAQQFLNDGKLAEGLRLLNKVLEFDPDHHQTIRTLGDVFSKLGDKAKARQMWQFALKERPDDKDLIQKLQNIPPS